MKIQRNSVTKRRIKAKEKDQESLLIEVYSDIKKPAHSLRERGSKQNLIVPHILMAKEKTTTSLNAIVGTPGKHPPTTKENQKKKALHMKWIIPLDSAPLPSFNSARIQSQTRATKASTRVALTKKPPKVKKTKGTKHNAKNLLAKPKKTPQPQVTSQ
jgi:hypothetical protein